jgi:predicted hydrolase (HD superfamily)
MAQHSQYGHLLPTARTLLDRHSDKTKAHLIGTGAAMEALAQRLGGDTATWQVAGLLHDLDWDRLEKDHERHCGEPLAAMLSEIEAPADLLADIRSHYVEKYGADYPLDSMLRKSLHCVDELTGFIIAVALVRPSKKLADVEVSSVKKKMKDKAFAAQVRREQIQQCEPLLNIPLDEFIAITLLAMKRISNDLGL